MKENKYTLKVLHPENVEGRGKVVINEDKIVMKRVPVTAPNGEVIVEDISFDLEKGKNLFIDGPNGSGKTSIFRLLSELWPCYAGYVETPGIKNMFFVP